MTYRIVEQRTMYGGYEEGVKPCYYIEKRLFWPLPWKTYNLYYDLEKARRILKMQIEIDSFGKRTVE